MEAAKFLAILRRHRLTLIGVPLLVVAIAYMLVRKLPDSYVSKATIAAGIADQSQQLLADKLDLAQEKTNQAFTNLIQMVQMRVIYDQVSYELMIHDLLSDTPYSPPSKLVGYLNKDARKHAVEVYTEHYLKRQQLDLSNPDQKGLNDVLVSMHYDYASLSKKMKIYRIENSDFIAVEFESGYPELSYVVVNTMCNEFITYYSAFTKENELRSVNYLNGLLADKKDSLSTRMQRLENYKIQNRVLNLTEEARSLYSQIADYQAKLESVKKDLAANAGALQSINDKFNSNDRMYLDSKLTSINQDILQTKQKLNGLNDAYIKSGFDSSYLPKINDVKNTLTEEINQSTDKYILNPLTSKENLMTQKLQLEVNQELAKNSVKSIQDMLDQLNKKYDQLVPNEAVIQAYEGDITVTSQEYLDVLNKFNETSLQYNSSVKVRMIEPAGTGEKQPSKKLLVVAISGVVSLIFCLLVLFVLFYLDSSIQTPEELADKTLMPVMGQLPLLTNTGELDLKRLWQENSNDAQINEFKNQLRSARFEIDETLSGPALINVTSLGAGEGKTLFALSLASAYMMTGKRVLLIDGNASHNGITEMMKPGAYIDDFLSGKSGLPQQVPDELAIAGNRGGDKSLFELSDEKQLVEKIRELKSKFDVIVVESGALNTLNKSKEWIKVSDKVVAVFAANKSLSQEEKIEVKYLQHLKDKYAGWVMNKLPMAGASKRSARTKA